MSRVEPDETHPRRQSEKRRADATGTTPNESSSGRTPAKAEGEERDVDEALENEARR
jgi:hypothetical protein